MDAPDWKPSPTPAKEKSLVNARDFFILNMQIFSFWTRSAVSAPPGEKAARMQPTGSQVQPQLTYNKENLPKINLPRV